MLRAATRMGSRRPSALSNRIGRLASEMGLSDGDLARAAGLSRSHLNRIKNRKVIPRVHTALAIALALRRRLREVFSIEEEAC
jgi:DNA-binding XRE family transcriptional regulator